MYARRASRRFTTMEGWRELGNDIYTLRRVSIRMVTVDPQFDLERYHNDNMSTRSARTESTDYDWVVRTGGRSQSQGPGKGQDPFDDIYTVEPDGRTQEKPNEKHNPFGDENAEVLEEGDSLEPPEAEEPYHVFSTRQKWLLVIIIGVTGMFSGLSSNIYFPALDSIARASEPTLHLPESSRLTAW